MFVQFVRSFVRAYIYCSFGIPSLLFLRVRYEFEKHSFVHLFVRSLVRSFGGDMVVVVIQVFHFVIFCVSSLNTFFLCRAVVVVLLLLLMCVCARVFSLLIF